MPGRLFAGRALSGITTEWDFVEDFLGRPYAFGAFGDWLAGR